MAHAVEADLKRVPGTREVETIGGPRRAINVRLDPARMSAAGVTVTEIRNALLSANNGAPIGEINTDNRAVLLDAGPFFRDARDIGGMIVATRNGAPVFLEQVATLDDGPPLPEQYVWYGTSGKDGREFPAVVVSVTKKPGQNAVKVADALIARVDNLRNTVIPPNVEVDVTRNYGATANDKALKLIEKLVFATFAVVVLVLVALGRREALIVGTAVVLTLAATLFASWAWGFTLNRVSLFALIFSIGILVDDAIVVVENIHRHRQLEPDRALADIIPQAVDEVGGPTILATLTVIAALLPMAFVSGLMGPYMSPIPINASMGMLISLAVAFVITPWLARILLGNAHGGHASAGKASRLGPLFERIFTPFLDEAKGGRNRFRLWLGIAALIAVSLALPAFQLVVMKMLPFDNKSEFQVVVDMPAGTSLERTAAALHEMGSYLSTVPEVADYQAFAGTSAPINFNGLVRQYYLRRGGDVGDLQVNLVDKAHRHDQSHAIATRVRPALTRIGDAYGARVKVVEVPPGPPVLAPIVAEIYGPDDAGRIEVAKQVEAAFRKQAGVVDADKSPIADAPRWVVTVDRSKAALLGVRQDDVVATLRDGTRRRGRHLPARRVEISGRHSPAASRLGAGGPRFAAAADGAQRCRQAGSAARSRDRRPQRSARAAALPQGPAAGRLRRRRYGGRHRQPALRDVLDALRHSRAAHAGRRHAGRAFHQPAGRSVPRLQHQVGRRVAGDLRDVPRHGPGLRGRPDPHLPARGRAVRFVPDAAHHHGAHPADDHRRDARPRAARRAVHRDVDDRHDRARRHHRPQLDPAGRLHQPADRRAACRSGTRSSARP